LNQQQLSDIRKMVQAMQEEMSTTLQTEMERSEEEEKKRLQAVLSRVERLEEEVNGEEGVKYSIDMLAVRLDEQNVELVSEFQRQHALHLELASDTKIELEKQERRMEEGSEAARALFEQAREEMVVERNERQESVRKVDEHVEHVEEELGQVRKMLGDVEGSLRASQQERLREVEEEMEKIRRMVEEIRRELEALAREEECKHVMEGMLSALVVQEQEEKLRIAIGEARSVAAASLQTLESDLVEERLPQLIKEEIQEMVTLKLLPLSQDVRQAEVNISDQELQTQNLREDVDRKVDVLSDRIELLLANLQSTSSNSQTAERRLGELADKLVEMAEAMKRAGERSEDEAVRGKVDDLLMAVEMLHGHEDVRKELLLRMQGLQTSVEVLSKGVESVEELRRNMVSSSEEITSIRSRIDEVDKIVESLSELVMEEGGKKVHASPPAVPYHLLPSLPPPSFCSHSSSLLLSLSSLLVTPLLSLACSHSCTCRDGVELMSREWRRLRVRRTSMLRVRGTSCWILRALSLIPLWRRKNKQQRMMRKTSGLTLAGERLGQKLPRKSPGKVLRGRTEERRRVRMRRSGRRGKEKDCQKPFKNWDQKRFNKPVTNQCGKSRTR